MPRRTMPRRTSRHRASSPRSAHRAPASSRPARSTAVPCCSPRAAMVGRRSPRASSRGPCDSWSARRPTPARHHHSRGDAPSGRSSAGRAAPRRCGASGRPALHATRRRSARRSPGATRCSGGRPRTAVASGPTGSRRCTPRSPAPCRRGVSGRSRRCADIPDDAAWLDAALALVAPGIESGARAGAYGDASPLPDRTGLVVRALVLLLP